MPGIACMTFNVLLRSIIDINIETYEDFTVLAYAMLADYGSFR